MTRQQQRAYERRAAKENAFGYPKSLSLFEYTKVCVTPEGHAWAINRYKRFYSLNNKYLGNGQLR